MKNHWDNTRSRWVQYKCLTREETSLGWNEVKCSIDTSAEWWEKKVKINYKWAWFGRKDLSLFRLKYNGMFSDVPTSGCMAWAPSQGYRPPRTVIGDHEAEEEIGDSDDLMHPTYIPWLMLLRMFTLHQETPHLKHMRPLSSEGSHLRGPPGSARRVRSQLLPH